MAVDGFSPLLAIRSSVGIELWAPSGPKQPYEHQSNLPREETKNSRSISFSPEGRYFAYSNGHEVKILQTQDWQIKCLLPRPKAFYLKFSPRGNYICTWELYVITKDIPEGSPNMFVYNIATGEEVFSIVQKKQTDWEPSWSSDESLFALVVGGEALFYDLSEGISGFKATATRIDGSRGGILSVGPGNSPPYVAFYTPGTKGAPSMCKLYKYPSLSQSQTVACKNFFNADRVEMLWNKRGSGLLLLTSTEVDKSGASYYGNQALHFLATKGDSCSVPLAKDGPVHCVKWSPKATEFVVVYGFMPSKAALYNSKCDVIFDFGEGPRNCAYFNPFSCFGFLNFFALVVLAGFGNLPGNVEIWDVKMKEKIANIKCPDTTHFEWNPNGEYFVTATTAPRLRIGNGFKVYHYSGALMHETIWPQGQELLGVEWQQVADNVFAEPIITKIKQEGIKSSQPEASKKAYTPPHLRTRKEGKNPEKLIQPLCAIPGLPPGYSSSQSSNNNSNRRSGPQKSQRNQSGNKSKTKKNDQNNDINGANNIGVSASILSNKTHNSSGDILVRSTVDNEANANSGAGNGGEQQKRNPNQRRQQPQQKQQKRQPQRRPLPIAEYNADLVVTNNNTQENQQPPQEQEKPSQQQLLQTNQTSKKAANPEKEKKIRNVAKKLSDIKKLKARQEQGEVLELNQLNKISMEAKFLEELRALKLSA
uniref:Eukaryotic translation initiation factor 2A n=1 Tax=Glossina brevipalpis TaxID=37001 RepID=A0A1A9WG89_9MUSC